jgi:hypothetical protein
MLQNAYCTKRTNDTREAGHDPEGSPKGIVTLLNDICKRAATGAIHLNNVAF